MSLFKCHDIHEQLHKKRQRSQWSLLQPISLGANRLVYLFNPICKERTWKVQKRCRLPLVARCSKTTRHTIPTILDWQNVLLEYIFHTKEFALNLVSLGYLTRCLNNSNWKNKNTHMHTHVHTHSRWCVLLCANGSHWIVSLLNTRSR